MTSVAPPAPRERILQAALTLLEQGGVEAVSTRAVSAAADVQPPTIYRQFGDMQGLLNAVASAGFGSYLRDKVARSGVGTRDPVEVLREGWDRHVEFGLTHPHLYTLMYGRLRPGEESPAAREAAAMLRALLGRVAEAGRLAVGVDRAAAMIHASAVGVTLTLLGAQERDRGLAERMREATLGAILTPEGGTTGNATQQQAAAHAVALIALLPGLAAPFSEAERQLLLEWLGRLT
ncbi:TetR/AcrR family transcriptional regulator [Deinococcus apachensis]|uniref:TetR/AcrR family transcriptional regulator n=1 Tax=Deinococcus apachensis TaxID=309886 RepID=UPI000371A39A|nr:TetR/AcrR family transcriptional regulator [Deinococcus apachensis]